MMNREIKLSRRATRKLDNLLVFLENDWSVKVKYDFISKLNKSLEQIRNHPDSFPESGPIVIILPQGRFEILEDPIE